MGGCMGVYFGLLSAFYIALIISTRMMNKLVQKYWNIWNLPGSGIKKMEVYMIYREKCFQGFFLQIPE